MFMSTRRIVSALGGCVVASALMAATGPGVVVAQQAPAAQAQPPRQAPAGREGITAAPNRRADEGKGPF
jgi:hypothetical protein